MSETTEKIWTPPVRERRITTQVREHPLYPGMPYDPVPADDDRWKALRKPFPAHQIGHKPQPWCKPCNDAQSRVCANHQRRVCRVCGQNMTTAHIDLDYVGHAAVTLRLLEVDPHWSWRFITGEETERYKFVNPGDKGAWIWLHVLGDTRPGLGEIEGGRLAGANGVKALMSDGIKNGAMRYGVAIETWSKEDLSDEAAAAAIRADDQAQTEEAPKRAAEEQQRIDQVNACTTHEELSVLYDKARGNNVYRGEIVQVFQAKRKELQAKEQAKAATPEENPGEAAAPEGAEPQ